jgi:hypothetical protein
VLCAILFISDFVGFFIKFASMNSMEKKNKKRMGMFLQSLYTDRHVEAPEVPQVRLLFALVSTWQANRGRKGTERQTAFRQCNTMEPEFL